MKQTPFLQALGQFESLSIKTLRSTTARNYGKSLDRLRNYFPKRKDPADFCRADIEDYKKWATEDGLGKITLSYDLSVFRAFFNWAIEQGLHPGPNPATQRKFRV